jgi:hypothetical protein
VFCQALIQLGLLLGRESHFGFSFAVGETLPERHGEFCSFTRRELEQFGKSILHHGTIVPRTPGMSKLLSLK